MSGAIAITLTLAGVVWLAWVLYRARSGPDPDVTPSDADTTPPEPPEDHP